MTTHTPSRRTARWFATIGILSVAAACSGATDQHASTSASASMPAPAVSPSQALTPTLSAATSPTVASPTTERTIGKVLGGGVLPTYSVELPDGWSAGDGHFMLKYGASVLGVSVWDVVQVPSDPCYWQGHLTTPGPTVDDLVRALVAQPTRNPSTPTDVTFAGYAGKYIEWSVPDDMVVTGDADFTGCDSWPDSDAGDFVSWLSTGDGERYQQVPGQVDRLWVLDVDGQRLVIDATYSPDATDTDRAEQVQVLDSLRFVAP
jgi:hypothetical protein